MKGMHEHDICEFIKYHILWLPDYKFILDNASKTLMILGFVCSYSFIPIYKKKE